MKFYLDGPPPDEDGPPDLSAQICERMNELGVPLNDDTMVIAERILRGEGCMVVTHEEPKPNERLVLSVVFNPRP